MHIKGVILALAAIEPATLASLPPADGRRVKVLVIEDEPRIREIFREFLELMGHDPDLVADGREALARFDPLVHELVLTDYLMPGLTGLEIAGAIQARSPGTPIVMISGSAEPDDELRAAQAGLRFLRKPITFAHFRAAVAELLEHAGPAGRRSSGDR